MTTQPVDLEVRIGDRTVTHYRHEGKTFVEGREGSEFAIRITNPHSFRIKAVVSLDGVNVVSGKPASGAADDTGYVLNPSESHTILGYRLTDTEVARFRFTKASSSYAQDTKGMTGTTGVIAARAYREKAVPPPPVVKEIHHHHDHWHDTWWPRYPHWPVWYYSEPTVTYGGLSRDITFGTSTLGSASSQPIATAYNCSLGAQAAQGETMQLSAANVVQSSVETNPFELGASFGSKAESKVTRVAFEVDYALGDAEVYFTTREGLIALGIDVSRAPKVAFPKAFGSGEYCSPPSGWQG